MNQYVINETTLQDIADAIKNKINSQEPIATVDFANKINSIETGANPHLVNLTVQPSTSRQTFNHLNSDGYDIVTAEPVTAAIDSNILAENIKAGVSILGVQGNLVSDYAPRIISFKNYTGTELDLEVKNLNTINMTSFANMFEGCQKLTRLDLTSFNTVNVTNMTYMFHSCYELRTLDLSSFNTEKVTNMTVMFFNCRAIEKIDISSFTTNETTNNTNMFTSCNALKTLIINNPKLFRLTNSGGIEGTPIGKGKGFIYVPDDMVETYKAATNWSSYADQIKGISELPKEA